MSQCKGNKLTITHLLMHLYAPELTCAFGTTHTANLRQKQTNPMTALFIKTFQDKDTEFPTTNDTTNNSADMLETKILAQSQAQTPSALNHPATKKYAATDIKNKQTTRFSVPHQFSNSKAANPTSCNPFYFIPISEKTQKFCPTLIDSSNYKISFTKCNTSRINQDLDTARIPTPYCFDRHPSPFTFASATFEPLFSNCSSTISALDCLSITTGLTNFIEAMSSDHPDPYQLDTPSVPQPTDCTFDPIYHVPFLQHHSDLDSRDKSQCCPLILP